MRIIFTISFIIFLNQSLLSQVSDSLSSLIDSLVNTSGSYLEAGEYPESIRLIEEAELLVSNASGKQSVAYADVCHQHGMLLEKMGMFPESIPYFIISKEIYERKGMTDELGYFKAMDELTFVHFSMVDMEGAEKYFNEINEVKKRNIEKNLHEYTRGLIDMSGYYAQTGVFDKGIVLCTEALTATEKYIGTENSEYLEAKRMLAMYKNLAGDYAESESMFKEMRPAMERVVGNDTPDFAHFLMDYAGLYCSMFDYKMAESIYQEAINILQAKTEYMESQLYAGILQNKAMVDESLGKYEVAIVSLNESSRIIKSMFGENSMYYLGSLVNLSSLYRNIGDTQEAESMLIRARKGFEANPLLMENQFYQNCILSLASLYVELGLNEFAEETFRKAVELCEADPNTNPAVFANILTKLGGTLIQLKRNDEALDLIQKSMAIEETVYGKKNQNSIYNLEYLAELYKLTGQREKILPLLLERREIAAEQLGTEHSDYGRALNAIGRYYFENGENELAYTYLFEAHAVYEKSLNEHDAQMIQNESDIARWHDKNGDMKKAAEYYNRVSESQKIGLLAALHHLSESELNQYIQTFTYSESELLSFNRKVANSNGFERISYDNALFYKGFLLNAHSRNQRLIAADTTATQKNDQLKSYTRQLVDLYSKPTSDKSEIESLEAIANSTEKELSLLLKGYDQTSSEVHWNNVRDALQADEVAIEFVTYHTVNNGLLDTIMYAAILVKPGAENPQFISLFEESKLDSIIFNKDEIKTNFINELYAADVRGIELAGQSSKYMNQRNLYEILWTPLAKYLTGIKRVYYSPAGLLHRINMSAIAVSEKTILADQHEFIVLNSTRQIVVAAEQEKKNNDAILFGGIEFGGDDIPQVALRGNADVSKTDGNKAAPEISMRGGDWQFLPGTEHEVNVLRYILDQSGMSANLLKGNLATESSFKNIGAHGVASPRVIHIATHGYFFPDPQFDQVSPDSSSNEIEIFKTSKHPMLRSGLILSGGNAAWKGAAVPVGQEDGILTAYEISQMNLSSTELVVMSACETGLGELQGNEGVFGLQRAFKIAGVKYIIMSLWQVPDMQTSLLMTTFYKKWLEEKMAIPQAFHAAQKELREMGFDAYQWAGFVLVE